MFQLPVVVVQSNASVFASVDEYVWTFRRFAEVAKAKEARLVVFPELAGLMLAPPLMAGVKSSLARTAGRSKEKQSPILQKARGFLAGSVAGILRANLPGQMARWFSQAANVALLEENVSAGVQPDCIRVASDRGGRLLLLCATAGRSDVSHRPRVWA